MRRFVVPRLLLALGLSAAFVSPAAAAELAGVELADSVEAGDEGFADVLFACWIGDKPATEELKRGMLGQ